MIRLIAQIDPVVGTIVGALAAALVTYLVAARNLSGKIKNSDAAQLWAESSDIRKWSTERVKELSDDLDALKDRMSELEKQNGELASENRKLVRENFGLTTANAGLTHEVQRLKALLEEKGG